MKQVLLTAIRLSCSRARVLDLLAVASLREDITESDFLELFEAGKEALKTL